MNRDEHDPLCVEWRQPAFWTGTTFLCVCDLIARVRADERARNVRNYGGSVSVAAIEAEVRERIAQAIEAGAGEYDKDEWIAARAEFAAIARGEAT